MRVTTTICTALLNSPHFTIRGFSDLVCQSGGGNNRKSLGQLDLFVTSESQRSGQCSSRIRRRMKRGKHHEHRSRTISEPKSLSFCHRFPERHEPPLKLKAVSDGRHIAGLSQGPERLRQGSRIGIYRRHATDAATAAITAHRRLHTATALWLDPKGPLHVLFPQVRN